MCTHTVSGKGSNTPTFAHVHAHGRGISGKTPTLAHVRAPAFNGAILAPCWLRAGSTLWGNGETALFAASSMTSIILETPPRVAPERLRLSIQLYELTSEETLVVTHAFKRATSSYLRRIPDASRSAAAGHLTWHGI